METLIQRFAAICEKYYEAADKTSGYPEMEWIIGESFDDFSVFAGYAGLQVSLQRTNRNLCHSKSDGEVSMPSDITDDEFSNSCEVLEENFERVSEAWKARVGEAKAALKARLQSEIEERKQQLESL